MRVPARRPHVPDQNCSRNAWAAASICASSSPASTAGLDHLDGGHQVFFAGKFHGVFPLCQLQQACAVTDIECQFAAFGCEPPLLDALAHFDLTAQARFGVNDGAVPRGRELCAHLLRFRQFCLFPQPLCVLAQ